MIPLIPRGAVILLLVLVTCAAIWDWRTRRIPNWLTVSGALAGLALNTFLVPIWPGLWFSLKGLLLAFVVYMLLHLLRAMGAGDVKLMAAVGSVSGAAHWFGIFVITALVGGVLAIVVSIFKRRLGKTIFNVSFIFSELGKLRPAYLKNEELDVRSSKGLRMPHGVVIAIGTAIYLVVSTHFATQ